MTVKIFVSLLSGNQEVKKRQMKIQMILDSKHIKYTVMDITEPGLEDEKDFMRSNSTSKGGTVSDPDPRHALPPQIFNDQDYCGDYDAFDLANEIDNLEVFLKLSPEEIPEIKKSTIDTSKLEPNSNGKVVEDPVDDVKEEIGADQDEDKENKTEEAANEELETDEKPKVEKNEEEISQNGEDEIIDGEDNKKDEESNKESIQEVKNEIQDNYSELADQQLEETDALGEEGVDEDFSEEESETSQVAAKEQGSVEEIQEELPENVESTEKPPDSSEEVDPIHEESEVLEKVQESYENLQPAEDETKIDESAEAAVENGQPKVEADEPETETVNGTTQGNDEEEEEEEEEELSKSE